MGYHSHLNLFKKIKSMLKYDFLRRLARFLTKNEQHLWSTIIKSIPLWILMTSVSCQCGNPDDAIFSFKKESTLCLKVDNPTLKGDEQTFCLTIENTSNKIVDLSDYELKTNIQESSITSSGICYQSNQGYTRDLLINQIVGTSLIKLTDQLDLKLNPGESLSLPSFTINPAIDVQDLTIHFELIGHFNKNPTATATVTWQDKSYQLEFQGLQTWIGNEVNSFSIHNIDEALYAKNITVEIESNNQVEFKIGNQTGDKLAVNLASLLGSNSLRLDQHAITPPISFQLYKAHNKQSAKVTLRLLDRSNRELDCQSVMWYITPVSLEGPDFFSEDSVELSIKVQAAKLVKTSQVKVYVTSTKPVTVTLNGQQVGAHGIRLADIIQGDTLGTDNLQTINLVIDNNPKQLTAITLELLDEKDQVLAHKTISWQDKNSIKAMMQDFRQNNTTLGRILLWLNQGKTLQEIIEKIGLEKGQTILHDAIEYGNKKILHLLLSVGADVNAKNEKNFTPLHLAVEKNQAEIIQALLAAKASVSAKDKDGQRPIHIAANNGNQDIIKLLLPYETSASIADKDNNLQRNLLHCAAMGGQPDVVKTFLQKGGTTLINQQDKEGRTALHLAVFGRNLEMFDILLAEGANKNMKDSYGRKPIDYTTDPIIKAKLLKSQGTR
jgi:ankyrin repeat protein